MARLAPLVGKKAAPLSAISTFNGAVRCTMAHWCRTDPSGPSDLGLGLLLAGTKAKAPLLKKLSAMETNC